MMIPGIDVSQWQRNMDWDAVRQSGVKFVFIKATEFPNKTTKLRVDKKLKENIYGASVNDILWGAYHFFRTHIDPVIQAKLFCDAVGSFSSLPPIIHLEEAGMRGERLNYKVKLFIREVESLTGKKPIIYTGEGFWHSYMCYEKRSHTDWARDYPLWVSQYTSLWPTAMYPWAGWDFWQYTKKGSIPGTTTAVNMNWFNGTEKDLAEKFSCNVNLTNEYNVPIMIEPAHAKMISGAKTLSRAEETNNFKGDFQEPNFQFRNKNISRTEMSFQESKVVTENGISTREEDWIKDYFYQAA